MINIPGNTKLTFLLYNIVRRCFCGAMGSSDLIANSLLNVLVKEFLNVS